MADPITIGLSLLPTILSLFRKGGKKPGQLNAFLEQLNQELARLDSPEFIQEQFDINAPILESGIAAGESRLNKQGLFSASPVARSQARVTSEFNRALLGQREGRRSSLLDLIGSVSGGASGETGRNRAFSTAEFGDFSSSIADLVGGIEQRRGLDQLLDLFKQGGQQPNRFIPSRGRQNFNLGSGGLNFAR